MRYGLKITLYAVLLLALVAGASAPTLAPVARAQGTCGDAPAPRLTPGGNGMVTFSNGQPLNVRSAAGLNGQKTGQLPEGTGFQVLDGPVCADNIYWWQVQASAAQGWVAEGQSGEYFVEPVTTTQEPVALTASSGVFATWDWATFIQAMTWVGNVPDPAMIQPPALYAGDLPALPIDLTGVQFVDDAALTDAQKALLAQNGFVVVPAGFDQFHQAYWEDSNWWTIPPNFAWDATPASPEIGHGYFVTTDAMLHALHFIFDNLLTDLEQSAFEPIMVNEVLTPVLQAAVTQAQAAQGTALETPAYNAALYLTIALELFQPGQTQAIVPAQMYADAAPVVQMAQAGEGQLEVPFLPGYLEDFSQYRPRGHYAGDAALEQYFRGMMWLGRITFLAEDDASTQMALLVLRALRSAPTAVEQWQYLYDTLSFLIGPADDLGPLDYSPLADAVYGSDLPLDKLADPALLAQFKAQVNQLPGPRINGLIVSNDTTADELSDEGRGFRLMGQRFTFDGYVMGQLMYPYVGTRENPRLLPLGLDVPSVIGQSEVAAQLLTEAGASDFANYDTQTTALRTEIGALTSDQWLANTYGSWLWALKPLWNRNPIAYPPLMNTAAWLLKDLQTGLASWTELKHDTVLYAKQPGGLGGGGAPLTSYGYVEPDPLVFARIAIVAGLTYQGILDRGLDQVNTQVGYDPARAPGLASPAAQWNVNALQVDLQELRSFAVTSAEIAEIARKELAGEALSEDDYWQIYEFGNFLNGLLYALSPDSGNPDPVALVTDVANNPSAQSVLQEAVGGVDYIYVVVPAPNGGTQLVRGGVFSYYEWVGNINQRMTDQEWRAQIASGTLPDRPDWISAFFSR